MARAPKFLNFALIFFNIFFISQSTTNFTYHGFINTNITTRLSAAVVESNGALRLTTASKNVIGRAFHPYPIPLTLDHTPNHDAASSFSTNFVFRIVPANSIHGGYGLAFTLSPAPDLPGGAAGHFMGVFNDSNDGSPSNHVFMVEFDTVNGYNATTDTNGNHVGVNINGLRSAKASIPAARYVGADQDNTEEVYLEREAIHAWIDYDGESKFLNVTVAPVSINSKPSRPLISLAIDLSPFLVKNMYAGFSAATGKEESSSHYILGWSFRLNGVADNLNQSLLPIIPLVKKTSSSNKKTALIAAFSAALFIAVASLIGVVFYRRVTKYVELEEWELDCPHRFRYTDLHKATKGFKESEKIGEGGFGAVYRGVLPSTGAEVAVKKITTNNALQGMREFAAEIESLGRLRQKNLVNLQGWCRHKNNILVLVYDYIPNGSLDSLLYNSNFVLNWEQRFNIIKGVASGLLYLHEEWEQVVIHRDVKSSNVLIDRDMSPRLGDFGLARLYDHGKNSHTTNVVGTVGYIAPELTRTGKASTSSDVFAYGILLLEIACGRAAVVHEAHRNVILVDWVAECMQMGSIFDAVDAKLSSDYVVEEMGLVLGLGLLCSNPRPESRPTMRQVMKYLNGDEVLQLFEKLSSDGSRRVDEVTSRFLGLGLSDSVTISTKSYHSSSIGAFSSSSFESGR